MDVNNNNNYYYYNNDGVVDMEVDSEQVAAVPEYYSVSDEYIAQNWLVIMQRFKDCQPRPPVTSTNSFFSRFMTPATILECSDRFNKFGHQHVTRSSSYRSRRRYPFTTPTPTPTPDYNHHDDQNNNKDDSDIINNNNNNSNPFECSICLNMARDPIVTCCGHLFCWSCFSRVKKLTTRSVLIGGRRECPVCKGEVKDSAITPVYVNQKTSRTTTTEEEKFRVPPRPKAQRVEVQKTY